MLRVKEDCLVLDRGVDKQLKDRFICLIAQDSLVDKNGLKSIVAKQIADNALVEEAKKHGAKVISATGCVIGGDKREYRNDSVYAFNKGDIIFATDDVGIFMELADLAEPTKD